MPPEYTYFRAEGMSRALLGSRAEAEVELKDLKKKLCQKYGADSLMGGWDDGMQRFFLRAFHFAPPDIEPPGWKLINRQMGGDKLEATFAVPTPGTTDHFNVQAMLGLMERASRLSRLETLFKCGEMPFKDLPAGTYSAAFVQHCTLKDKSSSVPDGVLLMASRFITYSNSATRSSDPLEAMQMGKDWYIRVPNDPATGQPRMTPPDAVAVPYMDMLNFDRLEMNARSDRARAAVFDPGI